MPIINGTFDIEKNNDITLETSPNFRPIITSLVDYTLTNQTVSLEGTYNFGNFVMTNSTINVGTGGLTIYANNISIDSTSKINASGMGYPGGSGTGAGGRADNEPGSGGAGYGGAGGRGGGAAGGAGGGVYGTQSGTDLDKGSGGGDHYSYGNLTRPGGVGGGLIYLNSPIVTIRGQILADGNNGTGASGSPSSVGGSGGGSGGGILIYGDSVDIRNTTISANGGIGGPGGAYVWGGGGGGGGRVKIFYNTLQNSGTVITVNGGGGGSGGSAGSQPGSIGSVTYLIPTGSASFTSSPTGAAIWVDSIDKGVNTPGTVPNLYAGTHNYTLKLTGYQDATGTFNVSYGLTTTVPLVTLTPLPGNVYITSTPSGARIYIDNIDQSVFTPNTISNLNVGTHSVKLTYPNYYDYTTSINIITNQTITLDATLSPLPGSLHITSAPLGTRIYIGDIDQGISTETTITNLSVGSHTVKLTHPNYQDFSTTVTIGSNQTTDINPSLTLSPGILRYELVAGFLRGVAYDLELIDFGIKRIYWNGTGAIIYEKTIVDDKIIFNVTSGTGTFTNQYSPCGGVPLAPAGPFDITSIFSPGYNDLNTQIQDICGVNIGTNGVAISGAFIDIVSVNIDSSPSGSSITITDGTGTIVGIGTTPYSIYLIPGTYNYTISKPNYQTATGSFTVVAGTPINLTGTNSIIMSPTLPCTQSLKYSGNYITLQATPKDGIGPYYVVFRKNGTTIDPSRLGGLSNPIINAPEGIQITRVYTIDDVDVATALTGTIDFSVYMEDSCPTGPMTCSDTCTINIGCIAPVCNFMVT